MDFFFLEVSDQVVVNGNALMEDGGRGFRAKENIASALKVVDGRIAPGGVLLTIPNSEFFDCVFYLIPLGLRSGKHLDGRRDTGEKG